MLYCEIVRLDHAGKTKQDLAPRSGFSPITGELEFSSKIGKKVPLGNSKRNRLPYSILKSYGWIVQEKLSKFFQDFFFMSK